VSAAIDPERASALKQRAALASIAASLALTVGKLAAGAVSGSLALLSEGAHNAVDIGASALTYFAIREADRPADDDHPFGHAKIEAVAALAQTGFLTVLAAGVAFEALRRIGLSDSAVNADAFALAVIVASIAVDLVRWRGLARIARLTRSDALAADALHYSSDLVSSVLVLAGLAATRLGFLSGDAVASLGVAAFIGVAGYRLGRRTIDALIDAAPKGLADAMKAAIAATPGVAAVESVRLRSSGAQAIGEVLLSVSRTLPLERVAAIKGDVAAKIHAKWPYAAVTITADPQALNDETILERVLLIAARRRLSVHHVAIQAVGARKCVSLDLEVDGAMPLGDAHDLATRLETAIAAEIGDFEVETHIEPMHTGEIQGRDAGAKLTAEIAGALSEHAGQSRWVGNIHDVRVRQTDTGYFVIFHCRADPGLTVDATHEAVDALERALREQFPEVRHIVGHAEPLRANRAVVQP
jgi:cation diffusion facilitator family transporter